MTRLTREQLRQMADGADGLTEPEQLRVLAKILTSAMSAADEIRGSVDRANRALDKAAARIAPLEHELAESRAAVEFWRGLAAGAVDTPTRLQ